MLRSSRPSLVPETLAQVPDIDRFVLFTEARERLGQAFVRGLTAAIPELATALENAAEAFGSIVARRELIASAAVLRGEATARAQRSLGHLYDLTFRLLELNQSSAPNEEAPLLALMHDRELDLQILADELSNVVRELLGPAYDTWIRRVDALTDTESLDVRAPLGAHALSIAALESLRPGVAEHGTRAGLRAAIMKFLGPRLAEAIASTDAWLTAQGVHPRLPAPPSLPEPEPLRQSAQVLPIAGSALAAAPFGTAQQIGQTQPSSPEFEPVPLPEPEPISVPKPGPEPLGRALEERPEQAEAAMERAAQALVHSTRTADLLGQQPLATGSQPETGFRHAGMLPRPEALEQDAVAFAHYVGVAPYTRLARQRFFESLRQRMLAAKAPAAQLAALDLVGAMFEYVVDDVRTPEAAKPLLWRLQQPTATLAALDAGYLGDDRRSVRKLVENVAAISVAYADDVTKGSELYRRLDTVVRAVEVVSHAFQARSTVLGDQVRREYERAAHGVSQLVTRVAKERHALESTPGRRNRRDFNRRPSRERELEVTRRLESALRERIARCAVPESVQEFLLGVWLRHLRTALLRDGEDSPTYRLAMQVVDDLMWTLDSTGPRQSRSQLASRIPPLIRVLTQGVTDIGARSEEFSAFLDELFVIHLRKMQKVPRDGDTLPAQEAQDALGTIGTRAPGTGAAFEIAPPTLDQRLGETPVSGMPPLLSNEVPSVPAVRAPAVSDRTGPEPAGMPRDMIDAARILNAIARETDLSVAGEGNGVDPAAIEQTPLQAPDDALSSAQPEGAAREPGAAPERSSVVSSAAAQETDSIEATGGSAADSGVAIRTVPKPDAERDPGEALAAAGRAASAESVPDAAVAEEDAAVMHIALAPQSVEAPTDSDAQGHERLPLPAPPTASTPIAPSAAELAVPRRASAVSDEEGPASEASALDAGRVLNGIGASHVDPGRREDGAPSGRPLASDDGRSGEQRLLTVLSTLDLGDFPSHPKRLRLAPDDAIGRLRRGDWLELLGRDGLPQEVKVAWINSRRTVVLLVRRPDRRALSLRASELHQRFAQHKATLIV